MKKNRPEIHKLSNGIPVILQNFEGLVAATYWWNQVGSVDEQKGQEGFAHYLEHMLFKDTAAKETGRASTGKIATEIEALGGDINAYTSFNNTVYHVTCAEQHWEKVLRTFGAMAKPQKFLKTDFEREREVILEELKKNEDSPGRRLFQKLFSQTFGKHPYGRPVIGFEKTLRKARVGELEKFYKENYVPQKMGLILVGPMSEKRKKTILRTLEERFGKKTIPAPKKTPAQNQKKKKPSLTPQEQKEIGIHVERMDVQAPTLCFSFRVPEVDHEDVPALDIATGVLALGETSRMYQELFYKRSIVTDVSGGLFIPDDPGMAYYQLEVEKLDQLQPALQASFEVIRHLAERGPTQEEIDRVRVNIESEKQYSTQTADGVASRLGFLQFSLGNLNYDDTYALELREVDAKRVTEVIKKYLNTSRLSIALLLPRSSENYDSAPLQAAAKKLIEFPKSAAQPSRSDGVLQRVETFERPSRLRVAFCPRPDSPVMSIHAAAMGGLRFELGKPISTPELDWGVSHMISLTWTKGTKRRAAHEIARLVEDRAASFDGFSGRNSVGLEMTGLARDWETLSDLFIETLTEPEFSQAEVNHSRRVAEDSVRSIEDHSAQLCSKYFLETLFEHHPYGRMTLGSLESLATMDTGKLTRFHQSWVRPRNLIVSISGGVSRDQMIRFVELLEDRLSQMDVRSEYVLPEGLPEELALVAPRWVKKKLGREQSHIMVGGLGGRIRSQDRAELRLLQTLLGGQSGRLFIELREKKGLAYTVSPIGFEGVEPGYIGTYIACGTDKVDESIQGIQKVLETLARKGPSDKEMNRAKEFYLGRRAMELQSDSSIGAHYGLEYLFGNTLQQEIELNQRIKKLSSRDIKRVCERYLVKPHQVSVVVG